MSELAILGGPKTRTEYYPAWPVWDERDLQVVAEVIRSGRWGGYPYPGPKTAELAEKFSQIQGGGYAVPMINGTVTMEVALRASGIGAAIARKLESGVHYELDEKERSVFLTDEGLAIVEQSQPGDRAALKPVAGLASAVCYSTTFSRVKLSMVIRMTSPTASVKDSGGTMPVPVIRNAPWGKSVSISIGIKHILMSRFWHSGSRQNTPSAKTCLW